MRIVLVCTANIVRSFAAERILKKALSKRNRSGIEASSAGIHDMGGEPADPRAVEVLRDMGFEADGHRSRLLTEEMVSEADMILVMEQNQKDYIAQRYPGTEDKVALLGSFSQKGSGVHAADTAEIRDPYNQSIYRYRLCFSEIYMAVEGLVARCI